MKRVLISSIAVASTLGLIAPAFAYVRDPDFVKPSQRQVELKIKSSVNRPTRRHIKAVRNLVQQQQKVDKNRRIRRQAEMQKRRLLRQQDRSFRWKNRRPKVGHDRYRILFRPNTRYFRLLNENDGQSALPLTIVRTGGQPGYDRPTRRDIRENGIRIHDRKRDILWEMRTSQR